MQARLTDFNTVKRQARFEPVLARYGVKLNGSGAERSALCPFHQERKASLRVNLERKVFYCFGCEAKGTILDFVAKIECVSLPRAAAIIAECCGIPPGEEKLPRKRITPLGRPAATTEAPVPTRGPINPPLGFTLNLEHRHPYLEERGVTPETVEVFGLGYATHGIMKGLVCIPIHDERGNLVAYAGRWPADDLPDGEARYRLPLGFKKSRVLFNLHRVAGAEHLVIVEGFWSVFRLHGLGVPAVALMGLSLFEEQQTLLARSGARSLTLLLDADRPGRDAVRRLVPRLAPHFFVRVPGLPEDEAPDTVSDKILIEAVSVR